MDFLSTRLEGSKEMRRPRVVVNAHDDFDDVFRFLVQQRTSEFCSSAWTISCRVGLPSDDMAEAAVTSGPTTDNKGLDTHVPH